MVQCFAGCCVIAIALTMTGVAVAQNPTVAATPIAPITAPTGYSVHHSVDLGGHMVSVNGSQAMYDTLVNEQSGPRVLGETFSLRALSSNKKNYLDDLNLFTTGFGGDANSVTKLTFSKAKVYEFSGQFRRDRQYFDYDLLGNANIVPSTINNMVNGVVTPAAAWPSENDSSVMFNTVRRMLDTNLTYHPVSKVTYRVGYSHNIFQGPTLTPAYSGLGKYNNLLQEFQRNGTDNYTVGVDWKPLRETKVSVEEEMNSYKSDSFFTLAPQDFTAQEADGTKVSLGNWNSQAAYGTATPAALPCNTVAMGSAYTSLTNYTIMTPSVNGALPVINPGCAVVTSDTRHEPTRIFTPTSILRLQSNSIKNISLNGDLRYTLATINLPSYTENFTGLSGATLSESFSGFARGHRAVVATDFGVTWQASKKFSLSDQVNYSDVHQPGYSNLTTPVTLNTPTTAGVAGTNGCVTSTAGGCETINYYGPQTAGTASNPTGGVVGYNYAYLGQSILTNNLTATYDVSSRARFSLTYRYGQHTMVEGQGGSFVDNQPLADTSDINGTVTVNETGGIFTAAVRPTNKWEINGSVEALYDDNAFTPVGPRQTRHYRVHTKYKVNPWTTVTAAFNDRERHNNTNNNVSAQSTATYGTAALPYDGPLDHVDYSRVASAGLQMAPNEHFGVDLYYSYSDVYSATNTCFFNGVATSLPGVPGTATLLGGVPNVCNAKYAASTPATTPPTYVATDTDWFARDFSDAPTQFGSASVKLSPDKAFRADVGYRVSKVNGSEFFSDPRQVNGSLNSNYQTPFVKAAWTIRPGLIWKAEYATYRYGEGGPSGPQYCTTTVATTAVAATIPVVPSTSLTAPTGLTEPTSGLTAQRVFRANNVTIGFHYEF